MDDDSLDSTILIYSILKQTILVVIFRSYLWKIVLCIKLSASSWKTGAYKPDNLFQNAIDVNTLISFQCALCTINCLEFIE